jgi:hypothetical protein
MRRAIVAAAFVIGCAPKLRTAEDEPITAAWLEYFDLSSITMLGGVADGDAYLGYTTLDGEQRSLPVHLGGPVVGMVFDMTVDPEWGPSIPLDFTEAEVDPVMLSDALGTYKGSTLSFVMGAGIDTRTLKNRHGIRFQEDHFALGMGMMAGFQWVRIREGGNEQGEEDWVLDDTGPPSDDSGDDSGDTDDTAIADDSAATDDTAVVADDSGTSDDTATSDDTGSNQDSGNGQTPPPQRRPQKDGCGDGGSTSDDDSSGDGGCCCGATNSAFIVGVWLLVGGRRRRRQR